MTAEVPTLQAIIDTLELTVLTDAGNLAAIQPSAGYTSDLLSCVMANAARQGIWVTLQAHNNIVAVAALLELSAVIITEGAMPEPDTLNKASEEGVTLLSTHRSSFEVNGKLWELGLRPG